MSLSAALNTAVFGLQTLQNQTRLVSGNVSNAQNPSYSRKVAALTTPASDGYPQAALIASITRVVAPEVQADLYAAEADFGRLDKSLDYAKGLAEALDATTTTGDQPTLLAMMTRFEDAWKQLEATPEDDATKNLLVQRGIELTTEIRRLNGLQSTLQTRGQQNIQTDIDAINVSAVQIAKLNAQIASRSAGGGEVGDLEDLRDAEVTKIADKVGIRTIINDRNELFIYTEGGTQLVGSVAQQLVYTASTNTITVAGGTASLNNGFLDGSIRASLDYLDNSTTALNNSDPNVGMLQKFFNQLDAFAANLVTVINNAYDDPATGAVEQFFATPTANAEAGDIDVLAALKTTPTNVDETRAGAVQQAMRTTALTSTQINRAADPNGLSINNVNIFDLANGVMAYHAKTAADNESGRDTAERQHNALDQKFKNLTGVNIDDELAQLQILQNNYAALANVMNTVTQMFDQLVNIGR
ncbi:flagellar hook-associated protein FlgK [Ferrovibrio xuzhouensis]|uniref:Flagellar hook-associated protein 1 n=1 Tax=Ferrovibrio xuzhouensis TaxID=1576914 RepID=A0ABV7VB04_9PROT